MKKQENKMSAQFCHNEIGSTKVYAIVAIAVLFLLGHAGYNYVPAAYQCENFKAEQKSATIRVLSMPSGAQSLSDKLKKQIRAAGNENGVPGNALIEVTEQGNTLKARVRFVRQIDLLPFGLFKYNYEFDNTSSA